MRKTIYVCDHCGKDMNTPAFTVSFKSNSLAVQEPGEWHYCRNCWDQVRTFLSTSKDNISWVKINDDYIPFYKHGYRIEDINKDSLDYKQTVGMI